MLGLIQRVTQASVAVSGETVGAIGVGLLLLLGVEKDDTQTEADRLLKKILAYRVFSDAEGRMNLSVADIAGGLLVVSQFTLAAATGKGLRPSFSSAKPPREAEQLYDYFLAQARAAHGALPGMEGKVQCGRFGADMQVSLVNDGPVTFLLKA